MGTFKFNLCIYIYIYINASMYVKIEFKCAHILEHSIQ